MKIYTKTGDAGETSLYGGSRVPKSHLRIEAIGAVDELNAYLGVLDMGELTRIQNELFTLGADLATPADTNSKLKILRIDAACVALLEKEIDAWTEKLPQLTNFILPGGSKVAAQLHLARAICRRAERSVVRLAEIDAKLNKNILKYLNRLSDWLFVLARKVNADAGVAENIWKQ